MKPILEIKNISKKYKLRGQESPYLTFRDALTSGFKKKPDKNEFWALQDISFDVYPGESIGIIGRNGAGKSTLLKILSRITPPTTGEIISRGRIASLLEVGTGFHAELSGRENVFLNGSILGLTKQEIVRQFDAIVDFSGVEKFLDTPLKHYSSGMQLRLAFAVAAHLEPEILIIDEVLAVGDAEFQKKCLNKMGEVTSEGRTVLFVSHNMAAVQSLCKKSILLTSGKLSAFNETNLILSNYLDNVKSSDNKQQYFVSKCNRFKLKTPYWIDKNYNEVITYNFGENYKLRFEFEFNENVKSINPGIAIVNMTGQRIFTSHLLDDKKISLSNLLGKIIIDTELNMSSLSPGNYQVLFGVRDENEQTMIYSDSEVNLQISGTSLNKNAADGVLWHTSNWFQMK